MTVGELTFVGVVLLTVGSSFYVVQTRNLVHSAIALLFAFLGVAGLYVFLMADFIAATQVLIYVGGILVLLIFGIMLTHKIVTADLSHTSMQRPVGGVIVGLLFVGLARAILSGPWRVVEAQAPEGTTRTIGRLLMIEYLLPFELASVLLLAALIGAAMLSRREG